MIIKGISCEKFTMADKTQVFAVTLFKNNGIGPER